MAIIYEGDKTEHFFTHFKGEFRYKRFDLDHPLLSCWKIPDRAMAFQILYPLPYCSWCPLVPCWSGTRLARLRCPILFSHDN